MPASPSVSGSKSAAQSRVAAKLQKELPSVAFLPQRHIGFRLCGLSAAAFTQKRTTTKTVLKVGYLGWKGGSSFASLWFERWLVWAYKCVLDGVVSYFAKVNIISLKLTSPASKFSTIDSANSSGSGRLSRSARDLSFIQVISRLVLSLAVISS